MDNFKLHMINGVGYYTVDYFKTRRNVKTCFSARIGGVSTGGFESLNLGLKSGDEAGSIQRNIDILCSAAGFDKDDLVFSDQVHGDVIRVVDSGDRGKGVNRISDITGVDALVTSCRDVAICIFTADCVPVFLFDPVKNAAALCHAGWRGIVKRIVPKTIDVLVKKFGCKPDDITAAIGPSIGPCCFNVGSDVAAEFEGAFQGCEGIIIERDGQIAVNLQRAVQIQFAESGLDSNIVSSKLCTYCEKDKFFSYRRDGSNTGRMISIMQLI